LLDDDFQVRQLTKLFIKYFVNSDPGNQILYNLVLWLQLYDNEDLHSSILRNVRLVFLYDLYHEGYFTKDELSQGLNEYLNSDFLFYFAKELSTIDHPILTPEQTLCFYTDIKLSDLENFQKDNWKTFDYLRENNYTLNPVRNIIQDDEEKEENNNGDIFENIFYEMKNKIIPKKEEKKDKRKNSKEDIKEGKGSNDDKNKEKDNDSFDFVVVENPNEINTSSSKQMRKSSANFNTLEKSVNNMFADKFNMLFNQD